MKVLVTGGAGFIGSNLVRELLCRGHSVDVLDDLSTGLESNLDGLPVELVKGSIVDLDVVEEASRGASAIVHLAARGSVPRSLQNPLATHHVNATGTVNVLEAARVNNSYVVFSSSSSVYGVNKTSPKSEAIPISPVSPYAASKASGEVYAAAYARSFAIPVLVFRFFNVFGPGQRPDHDYAAVVPKWVSQALSDETLVVNGDGSIVRDFTYVHDVVQVLANAIDRRVTASGPVNLAFGRALSLNDLLSALEDRLGSLKIRHGDVRPGDIPISENDPSLLFSLFPDAQITDFGEALDTTIQWLRSRP